MNKKTKRRVSDLSTFTAANGTFARKPSAS